MRAVPIGTVLNLRAGLHGSFGLCRSSAIPLCLFCTFVRFRTERKIDGFAIPDRDGTGHVLVTFITGHVIGIHLEDSIRPLIRNRSKHEALSDSNHTTLQDSS